MAPMLSPALREQHRGALGCEPRTRTVDLAAHRADSRLDDLDLGDKREAAPGRRRCR